MVNKRHHVNILLLQTGQTLLRWNILIVFHEIAVISIINITFGIRH